MFSHYYLIFVLIYSVTLSTNNLEMETKTKTTKKPVFNIVIDELFISCMAMTE